MSVFQLSAATCEELERGIRNFWWGARKGQRKTHWISWDKFIRSKDRGGLGFRDLQTFNQALLARQAWRLLVFPDSLCARLPKAKYFPNGDCNEHGTIYLISSDFGDRMTTQSM